MAAASSVLRGGRPPLSILLLAAGLLLLGLYKSLLIPGDRPTGNQTAHRTDLPPPQWHAARDCPIYFLDISEEVAPQIGIPQCHIDDPKVWPLSRPGKLPWELQRMESMQHYEYMYAGQYWLNEALRNASGLLTNNIDEACLVWVDTYCYNQWYISWRSLTRRKHLQRRYNFSANDINVEQLLTQALDHVLASPRFKKREGRDFVFQTPFTNPGTAFNRRLCNEMLYSHTLVVEHPLTCPGMARPKVQLRESQILPYNAVANVDLDSPIVGSARPTFLYMQANCGVEQCGMRMRLEVVEALRDKEPQVRCANIPVMQNKPHAEVQQEMRRSLFCLLVPGDNVSSGRLTEAILAGCIPVFIGAPWHEMPFNHGEVDWPSIGVFLEVTSAAWLNATLCEEPLAAWPQRADVRFVTVTVPTLGAAYEYLRKLPEKAIKMRQEALQRERLKLYYGVAPGRRTSALADIVFSNLLQYGRRVSTGLYL